MLRRATAQMRHKSEVLPAYSEHFNQGEICGEGSRDDKEWRRTGISFTVGCPVPGFIRKGFFLFFTDGSPSYSKTALNLQCSCYFYVVFSAVIIRI